MVMLTVLKMLIKREERKRDDDGGRVLQAASNPVLSVIPSYTYNSSYPAVGSYVPMVWDNEAAVLVTITSTVTLGPSVITTVIPAPPTFSKHHLIRGTKTA